MRFRGGGAVPGWIVLGALCAARAGAEPRIVGGTTDNGDGAVVEIYHDDGFGQGFLCSGTLIAPGVILTAGHCAVVNETCNSPENPSPCSANLPAGYQVFGGTHPLVLTNAGVQVTHPAWTAPVTAVHFDPGYGSDRSGSVHNDAAVLEIGPISVRPGGAPPTPMAWLSTAADAAYQPGTNVREVGFGITAGGTRAGIGTKRYINWPIHRSDSTSFESVSRKAPLRNTCNGDSGGPAIETLQGVPTVVGIISQGDRGCRQWGSMVRTDGEAGFIASFVDARTRAHLDACTHAAGEMDWGRRLAMVGGILSSVGIFPVGIPALVAGMLMLHQAGESQAALQCRSPASDSPGPALGSILELLGASTTTPSGGGSCLQWR